MINLIKKANYQFLKNNRGWALYNGNNRSKVKGSRSPQLGNSIWASAKKLGLTKKKK